MTDNLLDANAETDEGTPVGWVLCAVPVLCVGLHLGWPDVFAFELLAIACVVVVGAVLTDFGSQGLAGAKTYTLHVGGVVFWVSVGIVLACFYGWTSTWTLLGVLAAWSVIGGLMSRVSQ